MTQDIENEKLYKKHYNKKCHEQSDLRQLYNTILQ